MNAPLHFPNLDVSAYIDHKQIPTDKPDPQPVIPEAFFKEINTSKRGQSGAGTDPVVEHALTHPVKVMQKYKSINSNINLLFQKIDFGISTAKTERETKRAFQ